MLEKKTLIATYNSDCLKLADCVVVDVQCDYIKHDLGNMRTGEADMAALEATHAHDRRDDPAELPGADRDHRRARARPSSSPGRSSRRRFAARGIATEPLLAHSFERVMPGREYVRSIRDFWRVCCGLQRRGAARASRSSSREVLNTEEFPLTVMDRPIESETTKIVENSLPRHDPRLPATSGACSPSATAST